MKIKIGEGGKLVIPAAYRKALGLKPGDEVLLSLGVGEIRIVSTRQAIVHAQALVRNYVPEGHSLSDELILERQENSARA